MARKKDVPTAQAGKQSPVLYVLLTALIFMVGANTYFLWETRNIALQATVGTVEDKADPQDPVFLNIAPFTVNLQSDQFGPRLLYAGLTLELPSEKAKESLSKNMPQVRNRLLVLLSGQEAERITQSEGKRQLAATISATLSEPYNSNEEVLINDVLFTEFIVQ